MRFCINCMAKIRDTKDICPYCGQNQNEGVKSAFHLSPGITLGGGRYLVGKAIRWDSFSVTYMGRDLIGERVVTIQEYVPELLVHRQAGVPKVTCISGDVLIEYQNGLKSFLGAAGLMKEEKESLTNVAEVLDCFQENGTGYIVNEHLNGQTIQELLEQGHIFSWDSARQVVNAVLDGVESLNRIGVIHQDIHPSCILITAEGEIKIASPGGYRYQLIGSKVQRSSVVRNGYSAQEQYQNRGNIGAHTDVYGVAAVMYHMVTGIRPQAATERMHQDELKIPPKMADQIPANVKNAIMNGLQLLPQNRTGTPGKFQHELEDKHTERIVVRETKTPRKQKKRTAIVAVSVFAVICILGAVVFRMVSFRTGENETAVAGNVPNITNMPREKAQKQAEKYNMIIEVEDVLPSGLDKDCVISQVPAAGDADASDGIIKVVLSGGTEEVLVPDVTGRSLEEAIETLKNRKLEGTKKEDIQGIYTSGEDSEKYAKGCIVSECIDGRNVSDIDEKERLIAQGTRLELTYSLGDYEQEVPSLEVPQFVYNAEAEQNMTWDEAVAKLKGMADDDEGKMTFGLEKEEEYSIEVPEGYIIRQDTAAGEVLRPYSQQNEQKNILVTISLGGKPVTVDNVTGMHWQEAKEIFEGEEYLFEVKMDIAYSSTFGKGCVIRTSPAAGSEARQGDVITIFYSLGPEPKQETKLTYEPESSKQQQEETPQSKPFDWDPE